MPEDYVALAQQLIALQTTPDQPAALATALALVTSQCTHLTIEHFNHNGSPSVLIYNRPTRPHQFRLILNGHVDVIPGHPNLYRPIIKHQRIYGTGALDMKANLAVLVHLFAHHATHIDAPIALQVVSDEELGGFDGTYHQIQCGVRGDFIVSAETTDFAIVNRAKGILWLKILVTGITAHGAYPWRGHNAILRAHQLITRLLATFPQPTRQMWRTTVNVAHMQTMNTAFNKVPDTVELWIDVRFIPEDAHRLLDVIAQICNPFHYEIVAHEPPLNTSAQHADIQRLRAATAQIRTTPSRIRAAQGSSDARHYMHVGNSGIEFGARGGGIASDNEWISIPSLHDYYQILLLFLRQLR